MKQHNTVYIWILWFCEHIIADNYTKYFYQLFNQCRPLKASLFCDSNCNYNSTSQCSIKDKLQTGWYPNYRRLKRCTKISPQHHTQQAGNAVQHLPSPHLQ